MTDRTAFEQAAEALRPFADTFNRYLRDVPAVAVRAETSVTYATVVFQRAAEALAALTAESARVSPDREALARRLEDMSGETYFTRKHASKLMTQAAVALRLPAQAEVEAAARELENASATPIVADDLPRLLAASRAAVDHLLRRLSSLPPAVGEWRPSGTESIADLQADLARAQSRLARRVLGDPTVGVGSQPLPAPPQETEP